MNIFKRIKLLWLLNKKMRDVNYYWNFTRFNRAPWKPDVLAEEDENIPATDPEEVEIWHVPIYPKKFFFTPLNMLRNWEANSVEFSVWNGDENVFNTHRKFTQWPPQYEWIKMSFITHLVYKISCFSNVMLNMCFPFVLKISVWNELLDYCLKNMDTKYCLHCKTFREDAFQAVSKFLPVCDSPEELELKLSIMA